MRATHRPILILLFDNNNNYATNCEATRQTFSTDLGFSLRKNRGLSRMQFFRASVEQCHGYEASKRSKRAMAVELDGTFFQKVFRDHERDDSIEIFDMEQQPTCEKGENFLAVVTNVTVRGVKKVEGTTRGEFLACIYRT